MSKPKNNQQPQYVLHRQFADFDHLSEVAHGWDLDWIQLDRGALSVELFQVGVGSVVLGRYFFSRQFHQRGASPSGIRTFGLVDPPDIAWCGHTVDADTIMVFRPSGDYESFTYPGHLGRTVSITEDRLNDLSQALGLLSIDEIVSQFGFAVRCDHFAVQSLRRRMQHLYRLVSASPSLANHPALYQELNHNLPEQLILLLNSPIDIPEPISKLRRKALLKAGEYIEDSMGNVSIEDLCRCLGVSWRTLDYAFRDHAGVSPKTYLQAYRLNRVQQELKSNVNGMKISDIAQNWGFWHLSKFASDYCGLFGELPSATMKRHSHLGE